MGERNKTNGCLAVQKDLQEKGKKKGNKEGKNNIGKVEKQAANHLYKE